MRNPELNLNSYSVDVEQNINSSITIPTEIDMDGWKKVPINESYQPLIRLNGFSERIKVEPMYHKNGINGASENMLLRREAAERLVKATGFLPTGYSIVVFDAYRPVSVQTEIFNFQKLTFKKMFSDLDETDITNMTETYVSIPSVDPKKPSPHSTGGAVDLSICDNNDNLLDMGTKWDSFEIESRTSYLNHANTPQLKNRVILYQAMRKAGFTNYPEEWWHYDFGNQFWGHILNKNAIYGLIEGGENYDRGK